MIRSNRHLLAKMMATTTNFLSLLRKQREILNRLKTENITSTNGLDELEPTRRTKNKSDTNHVVPSMSHHHGSFVGATDPFSLINQPIIEQRPNNVHSGETLQRTKSRRISAGFEHNYRILSRPPDFSSRDIKENERKIERIKEAHHEQIEVDALSHRRNIERHNNFGRLLANVLVFDKNRLPANAFNVNESSSTASTPNFSNLSKPKKITPGTFAQAFEERYSKLERSRPSVHRSIFKSEFKGFALAMERSTKSQQDIHKWDRMIGLKRSHSKTMRLSMRSRSKLKKIFAK